MGKLLRCFRMWNCHFWIPSNYCGTWHVQGAEFGTMPLLEPNLASRIGLAPCGERVRARSCFQERPYRTPVTNNVLRGPTWQGVIQNQREECSPRLSYGTQHRWIVEPLGALEVHILTLVPRSGEAFWVSANLTKGESVVNNWNGVGTLFWNSK